MSELLDELNVLTSKVVDLDISLLDKKIDKMMPELGFGPEDNDRLVASYRFAAHPCRRKGVGERDILWFLRSAIRRPCSA